MHFISTLPKPHFLGVDVAAGLDARYILERLSIENENGNGNLRS